MEPQLDRDGAARGGRPQGVGEQVVHDLLDRPRHREHRPARSPRTSTRETPSRSNRGCQVRCRSAQTAAQVDRGWRRPRAPPAGPSPAGPSTMRASRSVSVTRGGEAAPGPRGDVRLQVLQAQPQRRQRGLQLVRGLARERPLGRQQMGEPGRRTVERGGQAADFGRPLRDRHRRGPAALGQVVRGVLQFTDGAAGPAGEGETDHGDRREHREPAQRQQQPDVMDPLVHRPGRHGQPDRTLRPRLLPDRRGHRQVLHPADRGGPDVHRRRAAQRGRDARPGGRSPDILGVDTGCEVASRRARVVHDHHLAADAPRAVRHPRGQVPLGPPRARDSEAYAETDSASSFAALTTRSRSPRE